MSEKLDRVRALSRDVGKAQIAMHAHHMMNAFPTGTDKAIQQAAAYALARIHLDRASEELRKATAELSMDELRDLAGAPHE